MGGSVRRGTGTRRESAEQKQVVGQPEADWLRLLESVEARK